MGSPPHAWGRHRGCSGGGRGERLTPTRVGTTCGRRRLRHWRQAHPHTRGDDRSGNPATDRREGSPPHAWGRRVCNRLLVRRVRLTPTRVGTTRRTSDLPSRPRAHPHTRGDDAHSSSGTKAHSGSPPHAWGRPSRPASCTCRVRLTPTRVGTTRWRATSSYRASAHPHTRGDDTRHVQLAGRDGGSPPHAWGRPRDRVRSIGRNGLTPTRVGTTMLRRSRKRLRRAHPHTRGDDATASAAVPSDRGSPPHAWGRPFSTPAGNYRRGLTPTRVGTTIRPRDVWVASGAHPHTRGDDDFCKPLHRGHAGSPPHAWGRPIWWR